ncbi:ArsC/Spx/MgsR family protein [Zoogloea sp. LCSB751]|uniref:ArsC/Spx/MgsR family protein n=1 Tax=Zoogloea sp. LCSB751 TaxID=1965277 RepID=UPI0009A4D7F5|nr:ArsC/Spx/MgsR family protein [Zoogloea sp. LCSB751]
MTTIEFFEKPGCSTNTKQVASLRAAGCDVATRSLLTQPWTADSLLAFLAPHPSPAWFNRAAPRVKSGEIDPEALSREEALAVLLAEPLLIRRPLIRIGDTHLLGFDPTAIAAGLGRTPEGFLGTPPGEGCSHKPDTPPCGSGGPE